MRDYKIEVMAKKGMEQITLKTINVQGDDEFDFQIGNAGDFLPLDRGTSIEIWVTSRPAEALP